MSAKPFYENSTDTGHQVVVIGGGLAGVLFAIHLMRQAREPVTITIVEPREHLGAGVAYSTTEPHHVTNVPASTMSADPDDPPALLRWLETHGDAPTGEERDAYPRRELYGRYLEDFLDRTRAEHPFLRLFHRREAAHAVIRTEHGLTVETGATPIAADVVVLATGNHAPSLPAVLKPLAGSPHCVSDPWWPNALAKVARDARVLIVGTGLTMGDAVASLRAAGHHGELVAVSRRGHIPQRGLSKPVEPFGDFTQLPATALALLRRFRAEVRRAEAAGASWYAVLAAARREAWSIWAALPLIEQRRAARSLRHVYELHRHVMPGPIHDLIAAERKRGSLRILTGRLREARPVDDAVAITWQPPGTVGPESEIFDVVINCTGPAYPELAQLDPLWAALSQNGLVRADFAGIGPAVDRRGRALSAAGDPQRDVLLVGTLARSAFGELTGVRELSLQARIAAEEALRTLVH